VDRIATQTSFNGQKVLDGTFGNATFQVGANVGETITVGLSSSVRTSTIGKTADYVSGTQQFSAALNLGQQGTGVTAAALGSGALSLALGSGAAVSVGGSASYAGAASSQGANSAYAKVAAINAAGIGGLTATADTTVGFAYTDVSTTNTGYSLKLNGTAIYTNLDTSVTGTNTALTGTAVVTAINANSSASGVTAVFDSVSGRITLQAVDGRDIRIQQTTTGVTNQGLGALGGTNNATNTSVGTIATATTAVEVDLTYGGSIRLTAADTITLGGTPTTIGYTATSLALGNSAINSANVTTVANANTTITRVDAALTAVSSLRSTFGAIQNRFDSTIANLQAVTENLSASRSRILDADFAAETANLTRAQILQQAGTAILAQANSAPQSVLALLK